MRRRQLLGTAAAFLAGCTGGGGSNTPTTTPTPIPREFPYTAASPGEVVDPRSFTLDNRTEQSYEATVRITHPDAGAMVLERTVTVEGDEEHAFEDIIGSAGTYRINLVLAVGTEKRYKWPIDEEHGDARVTFAEGDSPVEPILWFTITRR